MKLPSMCCKGSVVDTSQLIVDPKPPSVRKWESVSS